MDERTIADTIRREVRQSAGIPEGQEFRCDWSRVARAVIRSGAGVPHVDCWGCDAEPPTNLDNLEDDERTHIGPWTR